MNVTQYLYLKKIKASSPYTVNKYIRTDTYLLIITANMYFYVLYDNVCFCVFAHMYMYI